MKKGYKHNNTLPFTQMEMFLWEAGAGSERAGLRAFAD